MSANYVYRAKLIRVIDGDTYVLDADLGFYVHAHITVRLRGVSCPERNAPGGAEATAWVTSLLTGANLLVTSYRDKMTFARWVCDVKVIDPRGEPHDLAAAIVQAGHGVTYP